MNGPSHWEGVWRDHADEDLSWTQSRPDVSLALIAATKVGPDATIVDVGGGASRLVDHLLERGHRDVIVVDIAEAALERARRRLGDRAQGVRWIAGDVRTIALGQRVHVWHDRAVLHFLVEDAAREAYHQRLLEHVRPGGHVILGTFAPDGPERCSGLPVRRYDADDLAAFLGEGFVVREARREAHRTPWGAVQSFQWVWAQRSP